MTKLLYRIGIFATLILWLILAILSLCLLILGFIIKCVTLWYAPVWKWLKSYSNWVNRLLHGLRIDLQMWYIKHTATEVIDDSGRQVTIFGEDVTVNGKKVKI